jgi:hypothetical protein
MITELEDYVPDGYKVNRNAVLRLIRLSPVTRSIRPTWYAMQ